METTIRFNQTIKISPEALSQEVSGETVILDLQSESYFGLDEVGTRIWQLVKEREDLQEVFEIMLEEFDVDPDQLESDMYAFIDELVKSGLVIVNDEKTD